MFMKELQNSAEELNDISMYLSVIQDMNVNFKDIRKIVNYFKSKITYDEDKYKKTLERDSIFMSKIPANEVKYKSKNFCNA